MLQWLLNGAPSITIEPGWDKISRSRLPALCKLWNGANGAPECQSEPGAIANSGGCVTVVLHSTQNAYVLTIDPLKAVPLFVIM